MRIRKNDESRSFPHALSRSVSSYRGHVFLPPPRPIFELPCARFPHFLLHFSWINPVFLPACYLPVFLLSSYLLATSTSILRTDKPFHVSPPLLSCYFFTIRSPPSCRPLPPSQPPPSFPLISFLSFFFFFLSLSKNGGALIPVVSPFPCPVTVFRLLRFVSARWVRLFGHFFLVFFSTSFLGCAIRGRFCKTFPLFLPRIFGCLSFRLLSPGITVDLSSLSP